MTRTEQRALLATEIGKLLRQKREGLDLSMEQVAGMADMTANALWLIETGRRLPQSDSLIKLVHALQMQDMPLSHFAKVSWEPMDNGLPGLQLVIEAMRELLKAS